LLLHAHGLTPHPVACREPGPPRQRMGGRFKLSRADPARLATRRTGLEKDASTDFCNRPTTRAPCGSIDSRTRFPPSLAAPRSAQARPRREPRADAIPGRVELRLTATLQLRLCHNLSAVVRGFWPQIPPEHGASRSWRSCDRQPLRQTLPVTVFSTVNRACDVASDTLCRDPPRTAAASRPTSAATSHQTRLHHRLVKGDSLIGPGCLPSTNAPSARFTHRLRSTIRGFNGNPTPFHLRVRSVTRTRR
jgi:hypothetical protein